MNTNETKLAKAYELTRFVLQGIFLLPFLPLLLLMFFVMDVADSRVPSPPGTSKLRAGLFWLLMILIATAAWAWLGMLLMERLSAK